LFRTVPQEIQPKKGELRGVRETTSYETIGAMRKAVFALAVLFAPIAAGAMPMRGPDGQTIEADPAKEQFWINQGFRPITQDETGREIFEQARAQPAPHKEWYSDPTTDLVLALIAVVAAFGAWHVATRKR
jgi:hypothetical protein